MNYPTERGSAHPPPCLSSCSSLCQHKLLCLTNWIQELINWKSIFSLSFFFQRHHFPSGWEEHWMPFFPPSSKPNSPNFNGISTHADAGAEQHWALEGKKKKTKLNSHHDLKISASLKHCSPFCGEQFTPAEQYEEENSTGKAFQDKTEQKTRIPQVWKWESSRTGKHVSHLPDTDAQGSSSFSFKCLLFFLACGKNWRYSWEDKSDLPPLISESFPAREGRVSDTPLLLAPKPTPAQLDRLRKNHSFCISARESQPETKHEAPPQAAVWTRITACKMF